MRRKRGFSMGVNCLKIKHIFEHFMAHNRCDIGYLLQKYSRTMYIVCHRFHPSNILDTFLLLFNVKSIQINVI